AGPNERRCVMRNALGYYGGLVVAAKYVLHDPVGSQGVEAETFFPALRHCVAVHPILSAAIAGAATEAPQFVRPKALDLRDHVEVLDPESLGVEDTDDIDSVTLVNERLKKALIQAHDQPFKDCETIPPWRIVVLPEPPWWGRSPGETFWVIFTYSHSHGDGKSGLAFHKAFLHGLQQSTDPTSDDRQDHLCTTPTVPLLPPIEEAADLAISWSYLLGPLLGAHLPGFISSWFNLRASVTPDPPDMWRGEPASYDPNNFRTGVELATFHDWIVAGAVAACRAHGTKLTALLHQLIICALSDNVPDGSTNFVAQTAVDLRRLIPALGDNDMAVCATGDYEMFPRSGLVETDYFGEGMWAATRKTSASLATCAGTLQDQPIGLLHYLSNYRAYMESKLGQPRDSSYELSNIMSFDPTPSRNVAETANEQQRRCEIGRVVFSQPANAVGSPISFNFVTREGGDLVVTLCWQLGALGVENEVEFARDVLERFNLDLAMIAADGHADPVTP
ncbi:hypothetical protein K490DRAFT_35438, partial [Saccharata proteae CBS 121410]